MGDLKLSSDRHNKTSKSNIATTKIAGMCLGALSGPVGDISRTHCVENDRGTTHTNVKKQTNSTSFLKL
jgi:hypothetical protein